MKTPFALAAAGLLATPLLGATLTPKAAIYQLHGATAGGFHQPPFIKLPQPFFGGPVVNSVTTTFAMTAIVNNKDTNTVVAHGTLRERIVKIDGGLCFFFQVTNATDSKKAVSVVEINYLPQGNYTAEWFTGAAGVAPFTVEVETVTGSKMPVNFRFSAPAAKNPGLAPGQTSRWFFLKSTAPATDKADAFVFGDNMVGSKAVSILRPAWTK